MTEEGAGLSHEGITSGTRGFRRVFAAGCLALVLSWVAVAAVAGEALAEKGTGFREAARSPGGVISTESPAASEVGLRVLDEGGNAVDAAVAATFAMGVARPQSCGIGGGGFMVYRGVDGEAAALDFRETAPAAITPDAFTGAGLHEEYTGHLTVGVPGTVAGMHAALERYGTVTFAEAVAPAEGLARDGVEVRPSLSEDMSANADRLKLFPASASQFLRDGKEPYPAGATLVQPELADTLALVAEGGPDAFYRGPVADAIAADMEDAGEVRGDRGLISREDLAAYAPVWRQPLRGDYRGAEVIAMPPPTSGGVAVLEMLNILEGYDLAASGQSSADTLHLVAEAQKIAFADREEYLADPDKLEVPTAQLVSKEYAQERREEIRLAEAGSYEPGALGPAGRQAGPGSDENPDSSTTHLSVIDAAGNAVSLTCTIEQSFGSAVVAPGTGILLNNELTDFSDPGTANEPAPGKRPRSSMSPTIVVRDGQPALVVGGAGGSQIVMGSLLAVVNTVDFGLGVDEAIEAERLDAQEPPQLILEDGRVTPDVLAELADRGHELSREGEYADLPRVQAAGVDPETGERVAATDPRSGPDEYAALGQASGAPMPRTGGVPPSVLVAVVSTAFAAALSSMLVALRIAGARRTPDQER